MGTVMFNLKSLLTVKSVRQVKTPKTKLFDTRKKKKTAQKNKNTQDKGKNQKIGSSVHRAQKTRVMPQMLVFPANNC